MENEKYAMYLRKSRKDIEANNYKDFDVLSRHRKILFELADKKGIKREDIVIYEEIVSGDSIVNRPQMQQLLKEIEKNTFKAVFVMEIERLARGNSIDQGIISQAFELSDTLIITPQKTFDPKNLYDSEYLEFGLFMSRREYKAITRRIQAGRLESFKEGNYICSVPPFGYDKIKIENEKGRLVPSLVPNADAETVKLIFDLYIKLQSFSKVALELNRRNLKSVKGKAWTESSVRNIVKNKMYIGIMHWGKRKVTKVISNNKIEYSRFVGKDFLEAKGKYPPLIDEKTFFKAQEIIKPDGRKNVPDSKILKNPLAGLVKCKKCNTFMCRTSINSINKKSRIYCKNINCNENGNASLDLVEKRVIKNLKKEFKTYKNKLENYEEVIKLEQKNKKLEINNLKKEISELKKQKNKICDLLEAGVYDLELFKERNSKIDDKLKILNDELKNKEAAPEENAEEILKLIPKLDKCLDNYYNLTIRERNDFLKSVIKEIRFSKPNRKEMREKKKNLTREEMKNNFRLEIDLNI